MADGKRETVAAEPAGSLQFLYRNTAGRILLKGLVRPAVSRLAGWFMDTPLSKPMIAPFVRKNGIRLEEFEGAPYQSFNACFTRRIRPELRPIDEDSTHLISPCDCKLTAYPIDKDSRFWIKGSPYTVAELVDNTALAAQYEGGICLICRLGVDDYHRYCYLDSGEKEDNHFIKGVLHTVQPIALEQENIYKRNCREYTVLHTENFGDVVQVEVGAMLVGKIRNLHGKARFVRGREKGQFAYGGSTIVLLLQKDTVAIDKDIWENTQAGMETVVHMGEKIGEQVWKSPIL